MPVTFTTALPDEDQPQLGNGVEDEISVDREATVSDNGSVRLHYRETGAADWIDWGVVPYNELEAVITGLEDGERYEVRLRTETEDITGTWTEPVAITTVFPGATQLAVTATGQTSVDLEFDDNADNEDGVWLERRELFRDGFGPWQRLRDLGPNAGTGTVQTTDDTVLPETTYEYRVIPYTEHSSATSSSVEATTDDDGVRTDRVTAQGPHVVVERDDGVTVEPAIVGEPMYRPTLNGLPTAELPTKNGERWTRPAFEEASLRFYRDGDQLPIDTLTAVGRSPSQATLEARGGSPLRQRVERSYQSQAVHTAMEALIQTAGLEADVDVPATETVLDQVLQAADSTSELTDRLLTSITPTTPVTITNGQIETYQTCWTVEAEDYDAGGGTTSFFSPDYSGNGVDPEDGQAVELEAVGDYVEYTFTPQYDIPEDTLVPYVRMDTVPDQNTPGITVTINGNTVYPDAGYGVASIDWVDFKADPENSNVDPSPAISAGEEVTVRFEVTNTNGDSAYHFDVVAPLDSRFDYTFDNSVTTAADNTNYLDGPEYYPKAVDLVFEDAVTAYSVTAAHVDAVLSGTGGAQHLAVSNDLGATWTVANNTDTLDTTFDERGGTVRLRVRLSRGGSQTQTPAQGIEGQSLDSYELGADLDDVATLVNRDYDGRISEILTEIAEYGNLTWELVQTDSGLKVIVTRPGIRTDDRAASLTDYSVRKDASNIVTKAVVYGKAQPVRGEPIVADHGTAVDLANDYLVETSEVVRNADTGTSYARGVDYRIDSQAGTITTLDAGGIPNGASLEVDYEHRSRGVFEADDHDGDPTHEFTRTIPAATTDRACQQAALKIVQEASEPRWTAEATIDSSLTDVPLSAAINLDDLPTRDQSLEVWGVEDQPGSVVLQLGNRDRVSEVVNDIQSRLEAVARLS